ncbi:MAG: M23 family metallopeptidase [Bacteroidales bacterium]|nr:M23 family metallopeptidase [Bacteroidales bacterium]
MERYKYKYNPRTVRYEEVKLTWKDKFMRFLTYFTATLVLAVLYNLLFSTFFDTPREKELMREKNQLELQYEMLNDKFDRVEKVLQDLKERDNNIYRIIFETEPIPSSVRQAGYGGSEQYEELRSLENSELIIETNQRLDKLSKQLYVQSKSYDEIVNMAKNKEKMLSSIPAIMPVSNEDLTRTASGFGWRIHPIYKIRKLHEGMDFTAPTGTKIYATGDGVVEKVKSSKRGYGKRVILDHGFGYKTRYAHLDEFNVRRGEEIKRGDVIGYVGNSGLSVAPHLHYEVEKDGENVDPVHYYFNDLTPEQYERMIFISSNSGQSLD